ncbi:MAG: hypothetical protein PHO64_12115 [Thiomonas sp.]|nr:hypothetical protein [Thiomonas sp.]
MSPAALPPRAALALALAQASDPSCDMASAWLAAAEHPEYGPERLAEIMRAAWRREKRQGGAHGPARFLSFNDHEHDLPGGDDPAVLLEVCQDIAARPGVAAALATREGASDTRVLAQRDGCTRRRIQQCLANRRRLEEEGQGVLL